MAHSGQDTDRMRSPDGSRPPAAIQPAGHVIEHTISAQTARRVYDRMGVRHDLAERYEGRAKQRAIAGLNLAAGQCLLNVGVGTGIEHRQMQTVMARGGLPVGIDLSGVMLRLTQERTGAPLCHADVRKLPFASGRFNRLFCAYVLDLIPYAELPDLLLEFSRVLKPGGRMALVGLTEGTDAASKLVITLWKTVYRVSPSMLGGCRPLQLSTLVDHAGFDVLHDEVVVQWGLPSEILIANRPDSLEAG
jgi:ubiquinone/menaquinone biosynthesis C-methylase UbiE